MPINDYCECGACQSCLRNEEKLNELKAAGLRVKPLSINRNSWERVDSNLPLTSTKPWIKKLIPIAACVSFVLAGFLSWQQYQLKTDFENILVMNYLLEEKLSKQTAPLYQQIAMNKALYKLDDDLVNADSMKEKLKILAKRREIIEKYMNKIEGVNNAFSI